MHCCVFVTRCYFVVVSCSGKMVGLLWDEYVSTCQIPQQKSTDMRSADGRGGGGSASVVRIKELSVNLVSYLFTYLLAFYADVFVTLRKRSGCSKYYVLFYMPVTRVPPAWRGIFRLTTLRAVLPFIIVITSYTNARSDQTKSALVTSNIVWCLSTCKTLCLHFLGHVKHIFQHPSSLRAA